MIEQEKLDNINYDMIWEKVLVKLERRAPRWSHREVSDPGITLLEMWAVLCDMQCFYLDQIQESHYRKYLRLLGIAPDDGNCAEAWVLFQDVGEDCTLPAGTRLLADTMVFETEESAVLINNRICGLTKGEEDKQVVGMMHKRKNRMSLPRSGILFSILLEEPLREGQEFLLHVLLDENIGRNPLSPDFSLVSLAWEYRTQEGWWEVETLKDDTCGLLRSGCIRLRVKSSMAAYGKVDGMEGYKISCRVREGEYDAMPVLYKVSLNVVRVRQKQTLCCHEDGEFSEGLESGGRMELKSYLARTGSIRVLADQGDGRWKEITEACDIDPPVTAEYKERYVHFGGKGKVRVLCYAEEFTEKFRACPITGVAGQQIRIPWENVLRNSVELMLAQDETGCYREFSCREPEETRYDNAWHWQEEGNSIVLGDGRHGSIPPATEKGLLFSSLSLSEGRKGNVSIGRISHLERDDLFPEMTCENPMPGREGRDRKLPSEQFREAGESLKYLNRIVTKEDAAELAKRTPGLLIEDTKAKWQDRTIVVTVVPKASVKGENYVQRYRDEVEKYLEQYRPAGSRIRVEIEKEKKYVKKDSGQQEFEGLWRL